MIKSDIFPKIDTKRLVLRKISIKDARILHKYWSDPEVTKFLNMDTFKSIEQSISMINLLNSIYKTNEGIRWAIMSKDLDKVIGTCGYHNYIKKSSRIEIGYELGRPYWGNGYAIEAVKAIINYGFNEMHLNRIEAFTVPEAYRSIDLLEKLGFKMEGILREYGYWSGKYWDENIYSLLKKEWRD